MTKPRGRGRAKPKQSSLTAWEKLTWDDLNDWAGTRSVERGRSYQRQGRVRELALTAQGILLGWVQGGERYATRVELDSSRRKRSDRIRSECSCPVGWSCKHAVAVIVELLEIIGEGKAVSVAGDDDHRLDVIKASADEGFDDLYDDDEFFEQEDDGVVSTVPSARSRPKPSRGGQKKLRRTRKKITDADIRAHVEAQSHGQLVELVMQLCGRDPNLRRALADECAVSDGRFDELIREARAEIRSVTSEPAWQNYWTDEGELPEYDGLSKRLQTLLEHGHADAVVSLGEELVTRGMEQVEQSHDEGETLMAIADCLETVQRALLKSSRSDDQKILYAIDALLSDDYGLCDGFCDIVDRNWKKSTWSAVADQLKSRLTARPASNRNDDWSRNYQREQLSGQVINALDEAGRAEEATELCIDEARQCASYTRAVQRLIEKRDYERAESLAQEGLEQTDPKLAGLINQLQDQLCTLAAKRKDWTLPAAVAADRFFSRPSVDSYRELLKAAKKAKCEGTVQATAVKFLETGQRPDSDKHLSSRRRGMSKWPLPPAPQPPAAKQAVPPRLHKGPYFAVLIDLAIAEERPDDVLSWYDARNAANARPSTPLRMRSQSRDDDRIAEAIEAIHPQRAIEIYQSLAESIAAETNTKTYPEVGRYLKRIKPLLRKLKRTADWDQLLANFREKHARKRRLMEVLDSLEGRPIVRRQ